MTIPGRWYFVTAVCAVATAAAFAGALAQYPPSRQLSTTVDVAGGLLRAEGLSFELFGRPPSIEFVIIVVNDSPDTLIIPAGFDTRIDIRLDRGDRAVAAALTWPRVEVALPDDDSVDVSAETPFTLAPEGVARFHGVLTPGSGALAPGDYTVRLNLRPAVTLVRDAAGKPWSGYYGDTAKIAIRVTEPHTPAEQRRASLAAANAAMLKDDPALALKHFGDMLRVDADDLEAQYGSGRASLDLGRYRDAAAAFERVMPRVRDRRSSVYDEAAYAYLALGEAARAEAILTERYGAEDGKRRLSELRAAVRKR